MHIVQPKRIRLLLSHWVCPTVALAEPCVFRQLLVLIAKVVLRLRPRTAAVRPFGVTWDVIAAAAQDLHLGFFDLLAVLAALRHTHLVIRLYSFAFAQLVA